MDMKKMLAALDGVEGAEGTSQSSAAKAGSMKSLLESLDQVVSEEETMEVEAVEEEELEEAQSPAQKAAFEKMLAAKKGSKDDEDGDDDEDEKVDESLEDLEEAVMVSAEGDEAAELLAILQNAGMAAPQLPAMPEPEMEMQDEYSNSPDEVEMDLDAVIASGDDLHREKNQFAAAADGDNPMKAFEGRLQSILDEILAEDAEEVVDEVTEGRMSDQLIDDSENMTKEEFAKKHGKKMADEYYESVNEAEEVTESTDFADMKTFMKRLNG